MVSGILTTSRERARLALWCIFAMESRFFLVFVLTQAGRALANEAGACVRGTVAFRGKVPIAETRRVTVDTELCGKEALLQTVQVNTDTLGFRLWW